MAVTVAGSTSAPRSSRSATGCFSTGKPTGVSRSQRVSTVLPLRVSEYDVVRSSPWARTSPCSRSRSSSEYTWLIAGETQ